MSYNWIWIQDENQHWSIAIDAECPPNLADIDGEIETRKRFISQMVSPKSGGSFHGDLVKIAKAQLGYLQRNRSKWVSEFMLKDTVRVVKRQDLYKLDSAQRFDNKPLGKREIRKLLP